MAGFPKNAGRTATLITFGVFMTEAIIHYNMGRKRESKQASLIAIPSGIELAELAGVVFAFSLLSGVLISQLEKKK